jgi:hypothetical protein
VDATAVLAVVGAVTGIVGTLWALFLSVVYDRARLTVKVVEAWQRDGHGGRTPVLWVKVRNRGRRPTHVEAVARVVSAWRQLEEMSADIAGQVAPPVRLEEGQSHSFVHGGVGGYEHGDMPVRRWHVMDGGGRTFPLRERYRRRAEAIVFAPTRWYFRRQRRSQGEPDDPAQPEPTA